jgi:hypothetical protein
MKSEPNRPDFMGKNGFVWWQGVVEDIHDPLKLGRVRVRVLGWHTDDKSQIPTQDLPWAHVVMPVNSASLSGKGWSPTGLLQGSWVIGFFRDGNNSQEPVVFGTIGGMNIVNLPLPKLSSLAKGNPEIANRVREEIEEKKKNIVGIMDSMKDDAGIKPYELPPNPLINPRKGYFDPDGLYPLISRMGEADTNRLARNEQINNTIVRLKKSSLEECSTALGGKWKEPETAYNAMYPFNNVYESQAGHIVEYDDTPGAERMHWYHCSGTFNEVFPGGSEVHKVINNSWDITLNDKMILVKGNASFNTNNTLKIRMGRDLEIEVDGDAKMLVKGNMTSEVKGNYLHKVGGSCTIASNSNMVLIAPRIDFNPEGENASSVNTFLEDSRQLVNGLMEKASLSLILSSLVPSPLSLASLVSPAGFPLSPTALASLVSPAGLPLSPTALASLVSPAGFPLSPTTLATLAVPGAGPLILAAQAAQAASNSQNQQ